MSEPLPRITSGKTTRVQDIRVSQGGGILLGRQATGAGKAQEIVIGSGLTLTGLTLSASGGAWSEISGKPTVFATNTANISDITSDGATNPGKALKTDVDGLLTVVSLVAEDSITSAGTVRAASITLPSNTEFYSVIGSPTGLSANKAFTTPTTEGTLAITSRADGRIDFSDLENVTLTASKLVANEAARLALSLANAEGFVVIEEDTGKSWMLIPNGDPSDGDDWKQVGDRDIQWADVGGTTAGIASAIAGASSKTTPVDADEVPITDSAAGGILKRLSWANIKATLKSHFDTLYVAIAQLSTTGGANKVAKFDASGYLRYAAVNGTTDDPGGGPRISAWQRTRWENMAGSVAGTEYLFAQHSSDFDANNYPELLRIAPRHCWYWDDGIQFGNAPSPGTQRGFRHIYLNPLGAAHAPGTFLSGVLDSQVESVSLQFRGSWWTGSESRTSAGALQFIPSGVNTGELAVFIGGQATAVSNQLSPGGTSAWGRMASHGGFVKSLGFTESGLKLASGKSITFGDGSTMSTAPAGGGTVTSFSAGTTGFSVADATTTPTLSGTLAVANGGTGTGTGSITPTGDYTITQNSVPVVNSVATGAVTNTLRIETGRVRVGDSASTSTIGVPFEVRTASDTSSSATIGSVYVNSSGTLLVGRQTLTPGASNGRLQLQDRTGTVQIDLASSTGGSGVGFANFSCPVSAANTNAATDATGTGTTNGGIRTTGGVSIAKNIMLGTVLTGTEQASEPAAPAANGFTIYAIDDGAGKTKLMVKFATGAAQQLAIEP
jgi:hypothetical protein